MTHEYEVVHDRTGGGIIGEGHTTYQRIETKLLANRSHAQPILTPRLT
jgi:hypothetical protein